MGDRLAPRRRDSVDLLTPDTTASALWESREEFGETSQCSQRLMEGSEPCSGPVDAQ